MALAQQVEESLREAEGNLRNALAYAARTERPIVVSVIADLVNRIDTVISTDELLDKLENRKEGDRGKWGPFG
jgi:chromosomal replication initiation ATPase DnaA